MVMTPWLCWSGEVWMCVYDALTQCKHVLAARLSEAMHIQSVQNVTDEHISALLSAINWLDSSHCAVPSLHSPALCVCLASVLTLLLLPNSDLSYALSLGRGGKHPIFTNSVSLVELGPQKADLWSANSLIQLFHFHQLWASQNCRPTCCSTSFNAELPRVQAFIGHCCVKDPSPPIKKAVTPNKSDLYIKPTADTFGGCHFGWARKVIDHCSLA